MEEINEKEFDAYVESYQEMHQNSTKLSGYDTSYFDEMKIREVSRFLKIKGKQPKRILNFGCGIGKSEPYFRQYFPGAEIYGIDVSSKSVEYAIEKNKDLERVYLSVYDGNQLPFEGKFDLIFAANVFHHIPFSFHEKSFSLIRDSLSEEGCFFIFEHNPYNPLTQKAVKDCEFDKDAVLLSPRYSKRILNELNFGPIQCNFILFIPNFVSFLQPLEKYLTFLPIGAQYYCYAEKKFAN